MRSEVHTPAGSYLEGPEGLQRNSDYVRVPDYQRDRRRRNLAPSSSSGRLPSGRTHRSAEQELRRRDEEIAYLILQNQALKKEMARKEGQAGPVSPGG